MRFQQNLLLQKQQTEQTSLQTQSRSMLLRVTRRVEDEYQINRQLHNPLLQSYERFKTRTSEQASSSSRAPALSLVNTTPESPLPEA